MDQQHLKTSIKSHSGSNQCEACRCAEPLPQYIDTLGASALTGLSPRALDTLRYRGCGPCYLRIGRRIRYRVSDLRAWMDGNAVPASGSTSTHDTGGNNG